MGRVKQAPKRHQSSEIESIYDYRPVFKKRKVNKNKTCTEKYFVTSPSVDSNKKFYLGTIMIGNTANAFPEQYTICKICLKFGDESEPNTAILKCDNILQVVKCVVDMKLLKDIVTSEVFALDFWAKDEIIFVNIAFSCLPLPVFSPRIANIIKSVLNLFFSIQINTATTNKYKKHLHGSSEISKFYDRLLKAKEEHYKPSDENVQHHFLKPILRPYQINAVQWMLQRERNEANKNDELHPLYMPIVLKSGITIYFNKYDGNVELEKPNNGNLTKGGILADEMGLGKTVEVLACILANSNVDYSKKYDDDQEPVIETAKKIVNLKNDDCIETVDLPPEIKLKVPDKWVKKTKSANYIALEKWYKESLSKVMSTFRRESDKVSSLVQCICGGNSENELVKCTECQKCQHQSCLGYKTTFGLYYCPQCWMERPLLNCNATLIVTPVSLKSQWCKEIQRHIRGNLRVLVYEGYSSSPVYPTSLDMYDIVITTYSVLQNELRLTERSQTKYFRKERKYSLPGCPITRVKWRRLCLDEAQIVDTPGRMVSKMAGKIEADFRWAITGTPISKNISDLYGLIDYLQIKPYNDYSTYKNILYDPYINGYHEPLINFASQVLWRTSKKSVTDQINIPKQTFREHLLEFSAVENYFYKREHDLSSSDFLSRIMMYDTSLLLQNLDRRTLKNILVPLSSLRHTCTHPNTVRGRYLATKKQVSSMKELLVALILKNTSDSEECLRLVVSSLNGLAGISLLQHDTQQAIHYYREVLQLSSRFSAKNSEAKIAVDKLLLIHAMYNLGEVLNICRPDQPTLRDESLQTDCITLEKEYMEKFISKTTSAFENFQTCLKSVDNLRSKFVMVEGRWYSDGLQWIFINNYYEDLSERISTACENANIPFEIRNESERSLLQKICLWFDDIIDLRLTLFESINKLYEKQMSSTPTISIKENIVQKATACHLRPNKMKNRKTCPLCISNNQLKKYEGTLFSMTQRKKVFEQMALKGSWKPTLQELIFKSILSLLKLRNPTSTYIADGETHIKMIDALKKEFKELRRFWTYLDQLICAQDELDICKVRLELKEATEEEAVKSNRVMKNLSYTVENKNETVNILSVHELNYQHSFLQNELKAGTDKLEKLLGTQNYLETLRKQQYEGQSPDPCPICKNALEQHWSILLCGHSYCLDCIQLLLEKTVGEHIQCSVCRNKQQFQEISYIKSGSTVTNEDYRKIKGNYSTKIEAVITLFLELISEDPHVKVLLFSSWISILKCLKEALFQNGIKGELLQSSSLVTRIENFKDKSKGVTALLIPINLGSKGLNLIEATHVILVEPLLNPADELQAIGRIHRIGQLKPTVVHKFLVKNTIEETIHYATKTNTDKWDKTKVTIQNLIDLFKKPDEIWNTSETFQNENNATSINNE